MHPFMSGMAVLVFIKAIACLLAGWGLLQRDPWARLLTLVLAFVSLFYVPFGTALGVYTLWVLLPSKSEEEYEAQSRDTLAA
jgi:predicted membrane metal-binding protein